MNDDADDPLGKLQQHAERIIDRTRYERDNRRGLLWIHSLVGIFAGAQMFVWGSASVVETALGIWVRPILATLGITGGTLLALGLASRPRRIGLEVAGLILVGLWDLAIACGLYYARIHQHDLRIIPINRDLRPGYVSAYAGTVYAGLFGLICVHLWTLARLIVRRHR